MSKEEIVKLLMMIQAAYPNYKPQDKTIAVNMWHEMLKDYEANEVMTAFKAYVASDSSGFAPSIGQIIGKIRLVNQSETELPALEAWAMVSKALRNGYYGAEKEFDALPPLVQKAVGSPANLRNWSQTDLQSIENVVMSQFLSAYRAEQKREAEVSKLPNDIRKLMQTTERKMINARN
jgi:hypothetical protein